MIGKNRLDLSPSWRIVSGAIISTHSSGVYLEYLGVTRARYDIHNFYWSNYRELRRNCPPPEYDGRRMCWSKDKQNGIGTFLVIFIQKCIPNDKMGCNIYFQLDTTRLSPSFYFIVMKLKFYELEAIPTDLNEKVIIKRCCYLYKSTEDIRCCLKSDWESRNYVRPDILVRVRNFGDGAILKFVGIRFFNLTRRMTSHVQVVHDYFSNREGKALKLIEASRRFELEEEDGDSDKDMDEVSVTRSDESDEGSDSGVSPWKPHVKLHSEKFDKQYFIGPCFLPEEIFDYWIDLDYCSLTNVGRTNSDGIQPIHIAKVVDPFLSSLNEKIARSESSPTFLDMMTLRHSSIPSSMTLDLYLYYLNSSMADYKGERFPFIFIDSSRSILLLEEYKRMYETLRKITGAVNRYGHIQYDKLDGIDSKFSEFTFGLSPRLSSGMDCMKMSGVIKPKVTVVCLFENKQESTFTFVKAVIPESSEEVLDVRIIQPFQRGWSIFHELNEEDSLRSRALMLCLWFNSRSLFDGVDISFSPTAVGHGYDSGLIGLRYIHKLIWEYSFSENSNEDEVCASSDSEDTVSSQPRKNSATEVASQSRMRYEHLTVPKMRFTVIHAVLQSYEKSELHESLFENGDMSTKASSCVSAVPQSVVNDEATDVESAVKKYIDVIEKHEKSFDDSFEFDEMYAPDDLFVGGWETDDYDINDEDEMIKDIYSAKDLFQREPRRGFYAKRVRYLRKLYRIRDNQLGKVSRSTTPGSLALNGDRRKVSKEACSIDVVKASISDARIDSQKHHENTNMTRRLYSVRETHPKSNITSKDTSLTNATTQPRTMSTPQEATVSKPEYWKQFRSGQAPADLCSILSKPMDPPIKHKDRVEEVEIDRNAPRPRYVTMEFGECKRKMRDLLTEIQTAKATIVKATFDIASYHKNPRARDVEAKLRLAKNVRDKSESRLKTLKEQEDEIKRTLKPLEEEMKRWDAVNHTGKRYIPKYVEKLTPAGIRLFHPPAPSVTHDAGLAKSRMYQRNLPAGFSFYRPPAPSVTHDAVPAASRMYQQHLPAGFSMYRPPAPSSTHDASSAASRMHQQHPPARFSMYHPPAPSSSHDARSENANSAALLKQQPDRDMKCLSLESKNPDCLCQRTTQDGSIRMNTSSTVDTRSPQRVTPNQLPQAVAEDENNVMQTKVRYNITRADRMQQSRVKRPDFKKRRVSSVATSLSQENLSSKNVVNSGMEDNGTLNSTETKLQVHSKSFLKNDEIPMIVEEATRSCILNNAIDDSSPPSTSKNAVSDFQNLLSDSAHQDRSKNDHSGLSFSKNENYDHGTLRNRNSLYQDDCPCTNTGGNVPGEFDFGKHYKRLHKRYKGCNWETHPRLSKRLTNPRYLSEIEKHDHKFEKNPVFTCFKDLMEDDDVSWKTDTYGDTSIEVNEDMFENSDDEFVEVYSPSYLSQLEASPGAYNRRIRYLAMLYTIRDYKNKKGTVIGNHATSDSTEIRPRDPGSVSGDTESAAVLQLPIDDSVQDIIVNDAGNAPGDTETVLQLPVNCSPQVTDNIAGNRRRSVVPEIFKKILRRNDDDINAHTVHYQQVDGASFICDAIASAFHYLRRVELAHRIHQFGLHNEAGLDSHIEIYNRLFREILKEDNEFRKTMQDVHIKEEEEYDIFQNNNLKGVFVFSLADSDGNSNHFFAYCDGFIFHPSQMFALLLTRDNLNVCCGGNSFSRILYGRWYRPHPNAKKRKKRGKK